LEKSIVTERFNVVKITFALTKQANIRFGDIAIGAGGIAGNIR